jgi:hypothetical protein
MIKQILFFWVLCSSFAFTQSLQLIFDAAIHDQNDSTQTQQFLSITTNLVSSLEQDNLTIIKQRINEEPLSMKERFIFLDSLYSDLYLSISGDIKNDPELKGILETYKRVYKFRKGKPKTSKLDSLFQIELFRLTGKSIPDSAEIFYPITSMQKTKRLTHMALDLKPVLETLMKDGGNEKLIKNIVSVLHTCIMQYVGYLH